MKKRFLAIVLCTALLLCPAAAPVYAAATGNSSAWDGTTIDVSWYNTTSTEFHLSTPEQLMGLAAIVNGIYNKEITTVIGDASCIVDNVNTSKDNGPQGNNKSTDTYHYGADDFNGKTIYLDADLDMGGTISSAGIWRGSRFMPIGGQYLMEKNDSTTKLSSSFCGTFDGQGHTIYNIYCDRHCSSGNFGDGQSVGLIGRLGVHDNDDVSLRPDSPAVRNVAVTGYIKANRSVGGIVGKIGKTVNGGTIECCANFATVTNTDAKGCGGIVGAGWNGGIVKNCYNAGNVSSTYACPTGGISGSNEITLENCYSTGKITASNSSYAMAIGTNNGGAPYSIIKNCWYLEGSSAGGGYYTSGAAVNDGAMTSDEMKADGFVNTLGSAYISDSNGINNGYPVLAWQADSTGKSPAAAEGGSTAAGQPSSWAQSDVEAAQSAGLVPASLQSRYTQAITRAEFCALAVALYEKVTGAEPSGSVTFTDTTDENVEKMAAAGVVTGVGNGRFEPDSTLTREQAATMLNRLAAAVGKSLASSVSTFADTAQVADWAAEAVGAVQAGGIMTGTGNNCFSPKGSYTREQSIITMMRLYNAVK